MEFVQPIRDKEIIERFKIELKKTGYRNYLLFVLGINIGLRISDIIKLKVSDVSGVHLKLREQKTSKGKKILINSNLKIELDEYVTGMNSDDYLFPSQKGGHITRVQAYRVLNKVAKKLGLTEVGTHTLRKTYGYWYYQQHQDIAKLQSMFNHSSSSVTLRYIGISQDMMDDSMKDFYL